MELSYDLKVVTVRSFNCAKYIMSLSSNTKVCVEQITEGVDGHDIADKLLSAAPMTYTITNYFLFIKVILAPNADLCDSFCIVLYSFKWQTHPKYKAILHERDTLQSGNESSVVL